MNPQIQDAINAQIGVELASAYSYLAMAGYLENSSLFGAAAWMKKQAQEEVQHAMRFYAFVQDRGGVVTFPALPAPQGKYASLLEVLETALKQEQRVTKLIHGLYDLALQHKDYAFQSFLKWFLDEQVEEEAVAMDWIAKAKLVGDSGSSLYMLDKELGKRGHGAGAAPGSKTE